MVKGKTAYSYQCKECGLKSLRWEGKCSSCGSWNSFEEAKTGSIASRGDNLTPTSLSYKTESLASRITSGIAGIDRLLGGGLVTGGVVLLAGEPGIGKSTLLMQIAAAVSVTSGVLYVSGEESAAQITSRAQRLSVNEHSNLAVVESNSAEDVATTIASGIYPLVIVDSIQTMMNSDSSASPGSVSQVAISGQLLIRAAKQSRTALILVGHVTKEGTIAGPKVLEHLVDVVMSIDGDRFSTLRLIRSQKNRYGPTDELCLMEMQTDGLKTVDSASKELLKERQKADGSVVLAALDGRQPLLVEVQALVAPTSFGYPKRTAVGYDINRLNLLIAMLSRRTKLDLVSSDIYLNIVGGFKLSDPGADLAVCMAIATAAKGMELKDDAAVFGEVGLSGEIRHVAGAEKRIKEAEALGFKRILGPASFKSKSQKYFGYKNVRDTLNDNLRVG